MTANRILVYGVTGSGKTHLAKQLSEATSIPWHSVDELTFRRGWEMVPLGEQVAKITGICSQNEWILDSAYGKWVEIPVSRADLIVGLDYPRWVSLWRLLKRTIVRVVDGRPVCNGNRETLRMMFSRDSILLWNFRSFARKRRRIREWVESGREVVWHRGTKETEAWLIGVQLSHDRSAVGSGRARIAE